MSVLCYVYISLAHPSSAKLGLQVYHFTDQPSAAVLTEEDLSEGSFMEALDLYKFLQFPYYRSTEIL